ncbi:hypothetical protein LWC34_12580 [Kibdelosporangium philippinense]|uniref:Uncharacterized protein n=1 Tax=Kibdelosporangium philippinense TaxID=211113 RepID=A0ABS8ZA25_9PSEU|nr:hypothetical protein [Kibdelosporangium philippinense]MCE7003655.1 hypothetical protein [Kibdelosporangium philippinense]
MITISQSALLHDFTSVPFAAESGGVPEVKEVRGEVLTGVVGGEFVVLDADVAVVVGVVDSGPADVAHPGAISATNINGNVRFDEVRMGLVCSGFVPGAVPPRSGCLDIMSAHFARRLRGCDSR